MLAALDAKRPGPVATLDIERVLAHGWDTPLLASEQAGIAFRVQVNDGVTPEEGTANATIPGFRGARLLYWEDAFRGLPSITNEVIKSEIWHGWLIMSIELPVLADWCKGQ